MVSILTRGVAATCVVGFVLILLCGIATDSGLPVLCGVILCAIILYKLVGRKPIQHYGLIIFLASFTLYVIAILIVDTGQISDFAMQIQWTRSYLDETPAPTTMPLPKCGLT